MRELGVHDHRLLGGRPLARLGDGLGEPGIAGRRHLGADPDALVNADLDEAAGRWPRCCARCARRSSSRTTPRAATATRTTSWPPKSPLPQSISYSGDGFVGSGLLDPGAALVGRARARGTDQRADRAGVDDPARPDAAYPPVVVDDAVVTTVVDGSAYLDRKRAALQAHATQVRVEGDCYALSNGEAHWLTGHEAYQRVGAGPAPAVGLVRRPVLVTHRHR